MSTKGSIQLNRPKSLYDSVRSRENLFAAWRHVKRSALSSPNDEFRGQAAEFEHAHHRHLARIENQLRQHRFVFDQSKGVLKDKKKRLAQGKDPRPIAIASLSNRVVQRAILQVLQPREAVNRKDMNTRYSTVCDNRLGKINQVNRSKFGVGGLMKPYGGVQPAIDLIRTKIDSGADCFFQSDIKSFFTKIPISRVIEIVQGETKDEKLTKLFEKALEVHLENEDELKEFARLFPRNGVGVAQGSSLSAFAGNLLLFDLDHKLNDEHVTMVRYIDDLLMVSSSRTSLRDKAAFAKQEFQKLGFDLYSPLEDNEKAKKGFCSKGINFLGCSIQPNSCLPSRKANQKIRAAIQEIFQSSESAIARAINGKETFNSRHSQSEVFVKINSKLKGWRDAFSFCTQIKPFQDVDLYAQSKGLKFVSKLMKMTEKMPAAEKAKYLGISSVEADSLKTKGKKISGIRL